MGIPGSCSSPPTAKGDPETAKRAPEAPSGGWSGWSQEPEYPSCARPHIPTHSGPLVLRGPLRWDMGSPRAKAASGPITARIDLILVYYCQNRRVSPKSVEKAYHSPYIQNAVQKSPLDFLRFPFGQAFSHKELMGHFRPCTGQMCQNDEVSPDVHPVSSRERVVRYPHDPREQARLCGSLLI